MFQDELADFYPDVLKQKDSKAAALEVEEPLQCKGIAYALAHKIVPYHGNAINPAEFERALLARSNRRSLVPAWVSARRKQKLASEHPCTGPN